MLTEQQDARCVEFARDLLSQGTSVGDAIKSLIAFRKELELENSSSGNSAGERGTDDAEGNVTRENSLAVTLDGQGGKKKEVHTANVVRHGEAINIPPNMQIKDAIEVLQRRLRFEEEEVAITEVVGGFPWDGARALYLAMQNKYGFAMGERTPTMFGSKPPELREIEIGYGVTQHIPWGRMSLPNVKGYIETGMTVDSEGRLVFQFTGVVLRKHESEIKAIAEDARKILAVDSIYRGQPIKIKFIDEKGDQIALPQPRFLDVSGVKEDELIFAEDVKKAIWTNVFRPLERTNDCFNLGIPFKRGVLLTGTFGVGKTLVGFATARKAKDNQITFIMCEQASEFDQAIKFAKQYAPAVVFCEDIDRVVSGRRGVTMDAILNTIDGIEAKKSQVMVVLTTNDVESIHQAAIRPGRLDVLIHVTPPDALAVQQLILLYGRGLVREDEDLSEVGDVLKGHIPAIIREVVERSKLSALGNYPKGDIENLQVGAEDLLESAKTMKMQIDLLSAKRDLPPTPLESFGASVGKSMFSGLEPLLKKSILEAGEKTGYGVHPSVANEASRTGATKASELAADSLIGGRSGKTVPLT